MHRARVIAILSAVSIFALASSASGWTGPTQTPPGGNVAAPINVGNSFQDKAGSAWFDTGVGINGGAGSNLCIGAWCINSWAQLGTSTAPSQWITNGTSIYYSAGNVGIGIASPGSYRLAITGPSVGTAASILKLSTPGAAQGEVGAFSLFSTFTGTSDNGPRRTADITAGFSGGAWGHEYLSFNVGNNGAANDTQAVTSEKMRILGNGNVGIGISTPSAPLDVDGPSLGTTAGNTSSLLTLQNNNANTNYLKFSQIRNANGSTWTTATTRIQEVTDVTNQGYMDFNPNGGNYDLAFGSGNTEIMRLLSNGNVGIGTASPAFSLDVASTVNATQYCIGGASHCITAWPSGLSGSGTSPYVPVFTAASTLGNSSLTSNAQSSTENGNFFVTGYVGDLNFGNGWGDIQYTDGEGRFNIYENATGCSACTYVSAEQANRITMSGSAITLYGAPSGAAGAAITWTTLANFSQGADVWLSPRGTNSDFFINASGNVGIGTATPGNKLTLSNAADFSLQMVNTAANGNSWSISNIAGAGNVGGLRFYNDTRAAEYMRVTNAGNVGIGTASPAYTLDVAGTINATQYCIVDNCISAWPSGGTSQWTTSGSSIYYNTGNVGIGTAAPGMALDVVGNVQEQGTNPRIIQRSTDANTSDRIMDVTGTGASATWRLYKQTKGTDTTLNYMTISSAGLVTIPNGLTANGTILFNGQTPCLQNGTGCPASSGGLSGSGTAGYIPLWTSASALGNSIITANTTSATVAGGLFSTGTIYAANGFQLNGTNKHLIYDNGANSVGLRINNGGTPASYLGFNSVGGVPTVVGLGGTLGFSTGLNPTTESMYINSSGNVGIGTVTPGSDSAMTGGLTINGTGGTQFTVQQNNTSAFALNVANGAWTMYDKTSGTWHPSLTSSGGNIGIGQANPGAKLTVDNGGSGTWAGWFNYFNGSPSGALGIWTHGTTYALYADGPVYGSAFIYSSDARLKKDIAPLSDNLDKLLSLKPVSYEWIDPSRGTGEQIGFIAQQVQQIVPEVVYTDPATTLESIDYARLAPVIVGSVQELNAKVEAQQQQLNAQQQEIDQLKADIQALQNK